MARPWHAKSVDRGGIPQLGGVRPPGTRWAVDESGAVFGAPFFLGETPSDGGPGEQASAGLLPDALPEAEDSVVRGSCASASSDPTGIVELGPTQRRRLACKVCSEMLDQRRGCSGLCPLVLQDDSAKPR
mmetsp:Transcript_2354/g.9242  ORF Transcript_2354/g.9242 Transcript_2354/m.9242 type:complete len:130 (+) Transcript_2354:639-1028(+)